MTSKIEYKIVDMGSEDINWLLSGAKEAIADSPFKDIELNESALQSTIKTFDWNTTNGDRFVVLAQDGDKIVGIIAAMVLQNHIIFKDNVAGQEILWWVHKDHREHGVGANLMAQLEHWARTRGLKHLFSAHYHDKSTSKLKKMYKALGFKPTEYNYWKELA